jgi:hypothetical protein
MLMNIADFIAQRTGALGARADEWCAACTIGDGHTVFGLLSKPEDLSEPLICRFVFPQRRPDGSDAYSGLVACQLVAGNTWINLVDDELFDFDVERVIVYSRLSRICGPLRLDLSSGTVSDAGQ